MVNILIRYLGIKTKLLEPIKNAIQAVTPKGHTVLDLFAGSNTVGLYLLKDYKIISNDCQQYSCIAAKALIEYHSPDVINAISMNTLYGEFYSDNYRRLSEIFSIPLNKESELLDAIGDQFYGEKFDEFTNFFNNSPYCGHTTGKHSAMVLALIGHCIMASASASYISASQSAKKICPNTEKSLVI